MRDLSSLEQKNSGVVHLPLKGYMGMAGPEIWNVFGLICPYF
jgi:hypothetical protein